MILHGEQLKLNDANLPLERACTVTLSGNTVKTVSRDEARGKAYRPLVRTWKVEAQFLFKWDTVAYLMNLMRGGQKLRLTITGTAPRISTFTLQGDAYVTRCGIPAQGRGLVTIPVTFQGTGKPSYTNVTEDHDFRLNYSQLGEYTNPTRQPLI